MVIESFISKKEKNRDISKEQVESLYSIREEIKKRYAEKMHLQQWAKQAYMNITYLKEKFKKIFGMTPYHYLLYERVKGAKVIIAEEPDCRFSEVAHRCGFGFYNNLRRTFHSQEGKTLTEFRSL